VTILGPETERIIDELATRRRTAQTRERRLLDLSLSAVFAVALDVDGAAALLHGRRVPRHRLEPTLAGRLGIPLGGTLCLDLDTVEQIILAGPLPIRARACLRCGHREAA
jgi:hypothetical protein